MHAFLISRIVDIQPGEPFVAGGLRLQLLSLCLTVEGWTYLERLLGWAKQYGFVSIDIDDCNVSKASVCD